MYMYVQLETQGTTPQLRDS